jgi:hypothetical protein
MLVVIVVLVLASLMALVVIVAVIRKTPPMRLLLMLSVELLAVLALGTGNPQMFEATVKAFTHVFGA